MLVELFICFGICLSSNLFCLRLIFFLFSNLGLIITQQTHIHANCYMTQDDTPCAILTQKCILWKTGPGKTPSALRCLSYLISSFLARWKKSYDRLRQHIKRQRYYFTDKGPSNQSYGFSSHLWI